MDPGKRLFVAAIYCERMPNIPSVTKTKSLCLCCKECKSSFESLQDTTYELREEISERIRLRRRRRGEWVRRVGQNVTTGSTLKIEQCTQNLQANPDQGRTRIFSFENQVIIRKCRGNVTHSYGTMRGIHNRIEERTQYSEYVPSWRFLAKG